jgi:hypothetical protein
MSLLTSAAAQGYYKPFVTRTPTLVLLLFTTLVLIALTEYACHSIPEHTGIGELGNAVNSTVKRNVERELNERQNCRFPKPFSRTERFARALTQITSATCASLCELCIFDADSS